MTGTEVTQWFYWQEIPRARHSWRDIEIQNQTRYCQGSWLGREAVPPSRLRHSWNGTSQTHGLRGPTRSAPAIYSINVFLTEWLPPMQYPDVEVTRGVAWCSWLNLWTEGGSPSVWDPPIRFAGLGRRLKAHWVSESYLLYCSIAFLYCAWQ